MLDGYHKIRIVKTSEVNEGRITFKKFIADGFAVAPELTGINIEFIGDSISTGYGALAPTGESRTKDNSDSSCSYAYQTAKILDAKYSVIARQGICVAATYNTSDIMLNLYKKTCYYESMSYAFQEQMDVVVINLGTNDDGYLS